MSSGSVIRGATAHLWVDCGCHLAESPRWDDRSGRLLWVDLEAGNLWSCGDPTDATRIPLGRATGVATPREDGGLVTAGPGGITWTNGWGKAQHTVDLPEEWSTMRMNDGSCDPAGRLLCGSVPWEPGSRPGRLHQIDGAGEVRTLLDGIGMSNGIGWSPDGSTVYHVDTLAQSVTAYDYAPSTGAIGASRGSFLVDTDVGMPDGLTVDSEGNLWVAVWGGARVVRYSPKGAVLGEVTVPARFVTSCTFGGPELRDLFITTARWDLAAEDLAEEPTAGGVFRFSTEVRGLPLMRFAGPPPPRPVDQTPNDGEMHEDR